MVTESYLQIAQIYLKTKSLENLKDAFPKVSFNYLIANQYS